MSTTIAIAAYKPFVTYLQAKCVSDNGELDPAYGYCTAKMPDLHLATDGMLHGSLNVSLSDYPGFYPDQKVPMTASEGARLCLRGVTEELNSSLLGTMPGVRIAIDTVTVRKRPEGSKEAIELGTVPGATITIGSPSATRPTHALAALAERFPGAYKLGDEWHAFELDGAKYQYRVRRYFEPTSDDALRIAIQARDSHQAAEVGPDVHAKAEQLVRAEFAAFQKELGQSVTLDVEHFKYITGHGPKCGSDD